LAGKRRVERSHASVVPRWGSGLSYTCSGALALVALGVGLQLGLHDGALSRALLGAEILLLCAALATYRGVRRRTHDLTLVHRFVAAGFGRSTSSNPTLVAGRDSPSCELAPGAELLDRTRIFMASQCAELVVEDSHGRFTRLRVRAGAGNASVMEVDEDATTAADWLLMRSCEQGEPTLVGARTRDHSLRQWLDAGDTREALIVPVRQESGSAVLVMRNRDTSHSSGGRHFTRRDLRILEDISEHFAGALHTSQLLYQLRYDSTHDPLTGLSNRTVLCARLEAELARSPAHADRSSDGAGTLAVLLLDLDRFKEVNDTLGHHVGDTLLQVVAERLREALPASATIARLGGDEFAIVLSGLIDADSESRQYAAAVVASLATPVRLDDALLSTAVSIGIALVDYELSSGDLLRQADTAMYTAKTGTEPVVVYSAALDYGRAERLALASDLQRALEGDEFVLLYQPKLSLKTGNVMGVEALVRWEHPELGLLEPDAFIPIAEATGLVEPLTRIVLTKALRQCRAWSVGGLDLSVAVNLPARSVANPGLPAAVTELLRRSGVDPSRLILEITEASVMDDPERSVPVLEKLAATGVTLSLDDFGVGYASLSFLQRLPVRELKIDRSFVIGLADPLSEPASTLLVRSILSLAAGMDLRVVAEGVEDEHCLRTLHELGVDVAQGYHVGRPMEPEHLQRHLSGDSVAPAYALPPPRGQVRLPSSPGSSSL
jgi:diguanylate cyclase (GGDEF)-like protein